MTPRPPQPDRRRFLTWASASAAVIAAHDRLAADDPRPAPPGGRVKTDPRILSLELLTAAPLAEMKAFYHRTLGLPVADERPDRLTIAAGGTRLTFVKAGEDDGKPFYHFAFNIPENKAAAAHDWQKERGPLIPIPARLRDPKFPDGVVNYSHWNAHSVFFFDPGGNVVEYIARHDLGNAAPGPFGGGDILYASEIAWVVDDVPAAVAGLREVVGLDRYKGGDDQFAALGDERGLLLVMKRGRVISFDAEDKKVVGVFRTAAAVRGAGRARYRFPKFPYELTVEE
jgi:catechol 2,3-dioxygenase-like lactoylglutathione lyase family enzyme